MPWPKLTPLQSRFAASLAATILLIILYFALSNPHLAYATDVDALILERHGPPDLILIDTHEQISVQRLDAEDGVDIERRAAPGTEALANNVAKLKNIKIGETQYWVFPKEAVHGPKSPPTPGLPSDISVILSGGTTTPNNNSGDSEDSDDTDNKLELGSRDTKLSRRSVSVYITANTCLQPALNATRAAKDAGPPQLELYVSTSKTFDRPGPQYKDNSAVTHKPFDGGYVAVNPNTDGDVYIAVSAPSSTRYSGIYNYEIAASIDAPFHGLENRTSFLYFVDGDSDAALLQTNDTTREPPESEIYKQWLALDPPPFTLFAHNMNDSAILGLQHSFCGLQNNAQISKKQKSLDVGMTARGMDHKPKQQIYAQGLNRSSVYYGFLAMEGNSTNYGNKVVGGGGKVWKAMNFTTKTENNCAIIYNLKFCSEVAYAVPSSPDLSVTQLSEIYDTQAKQLFQNFSYSLQQVSCNAPATEQYSLATNCTQCAGAYKQWLCAVTIPRCQDFSSDLPFLRPRNTGQQFLNGTVLPDDYSGRLNVLTNSSRNPLIDSKIKPGPYKEVLPCQDLCHSLVRSCPASFGFGCPTGQWLNYSYGQRSANGDITCSYLGAAYFLNSGWKSMDGMKFIFSFTLVFWGLVWGFLHWD
ncbi:calcium influx-promoting protein ehs1 [Nannizzia gypsea CBS 118893]|uniref:Calcium influx-promoting protein ehs1 n=1 Tax=Arthroderma gypseum (strain ATCC MYA-4604 / CBS 118893) TaxID=535722 RepID=E4UU78_ARTGP|nr:calcium influx-promoting protein ehs1 [Nannizzia gypsea CBS 118893]EFR00845.1 calcium influx-promoting protein ehs1 [Nannizzia gypsea CBS 118893]